MNRVLLILLGYLMLLVSCKEGQEESTELFSCDDSGFVDQISTPNFKMGFSTWSFGPDESDKQDTYQFITENANIYSEQIDNKIPWAQLIAGTDLPVEFTNDIQDRVSRRPQGHELLLSVSLLNSGRSDLLEDYDGSIPAYTTLNEQKIEDAYFKHLDYLIGQLNPAYLVLAMEVNELKMKSDTRWTEYKSLMENIRSRVKSKYPALLLSESVTLHNLFNPEVENPDTYIAGIVDYVNQSSDFAAISYYPFFKGQHTKAQFQLAFDFLNEKVTKPIAFVETNHLAETLVIDALDLTITSDVCEQRDYLEVLLSNAYDKQYLFVIWWSFRDFDELWETFPAEYKDLGKLWRDTGLLDEKGNERPAYAVWKAVFDAAKN